MVQFAIKMTDGACNEWVIMELQGDIETRHNISLHRQNLADLHFTKKGEPVMIVGHHILYGKVSHLDKPFAVIVKETSSDLPIKNPGDCNRQPHNVSYRVQAIIRTKIHFKTRPKPIIANVPKTI